MNGLRPVLSTLILLMFITGGVYPLLITALGQWWFPHQTNGSLLREDQVIRDSALIGQYFAAAGYFQGRSSATAETPYNPMASSGSNLAVSNLELDKQLQSRIAALHAANPQVNPVVPVELVTTSANGLNNNLTPAMVVWQVPRVMQVRSLSAEEVTRLVARYMQKPLVSFIGQPVASLVEFNLALDKHREKGHA